MNLDDINNSNNGTPVKRNTRGLMLLVDRKVFFLLLDFLPTVFQFIYSDFFINVQCTCSKRVRYLGCVEFMFFFCSYRFTFYFSR